MRNMTAFLGKEFRLYFVSPAAYVVMIGFLILAGFFFYDLVTTFSQMLSYYQMYQNPYIMEQLNVNDMVVGPLFQNINVILLLIIPILTMRAFAEEKKLGTDELILTSPVSVHQVVLGKFFAAVLFFVLIMALTAHFPIILAKFSNPDPGKILSGYLGLFLMGTAFISFGIFASSLTENQIVAAVISFSTLLLFWIVGWMAESVGAPMGDVLRYLSITEHLRASSREW